MLGTTRATVYGYSIFEMEVYGVTNQAPDANAGTDKSITLPTNSVVINGSGTDPDGTISSYAWSTVSGPNTPSLSGAATANLTASSLVAGTYVFRLTVTDNGGLTDTDDVNVVVNSVPSSNLALNKTVTVSSTQPAQAVSYDGFKAVDGNLTTRWSSEFSDPQWIYVDLGATYFVNRVKITWEDGYATAYQVQISTNASAWTTMKNITGNTTLVNDHTTGISGTGRYIRIYGTARALEWGYSIFELEVYGGTPPTANAGVDKNVTLPTNSVVINGSGSDADGTISSYAWTTISGPNTPTLSGAGTANLTANGLVSGTYVFRLTVTDNSGATGTDDVNVAVYNVPGSNLALNKPVTVSSTQPAQATSYDAFKAVDGNSTTTRWSSEFTDPQWIYVDLGASYTVNRVKVTWEAAYATAYQVQISTNASSWTTMKSVTGNNTLVNDHTTGIAGTGRYIRIYGTTRATVYGYSIFELEVYGTSPSGRLGTPTGTSQTKEQLHATPDPSPVLEQQSLVFYPNPVKEILIIRTVKGSGVSLTDPGGKVVKAIANSESQVELNLADLASGFYIMKVRTPSGLQIHKIIKE
jgi:hypothetical protein